MTLWFYTVVLFVCFISQVVLGQQILWLCTSCWSSQHVFWVVGFFVVACIVDYLRKQHLAPRLLSLSLSLSLSPPTPDGHFTGLIDDMGLWDDGCRALMMQSMNVVWRTVERGRMASSLRPTYTLALMCTVGLLACCCCKTGREKKSRLAMRVVCNEVHSLEGLGRITRWWVDA